MVEMEVNMGIVSVEDEIVVQEIQTTCLLTEFHTYRNTWTARRARKTLKGIMIKVNWINIFHLMIYLDLCFVKG